MFFGQGGAMSADSGLRDKIYTSKVTSEVAQSCPTLCNPTDCSLPGSSVHGIFQTRILEWLPFPSPGELSDPEIKPSFLASPAPAGRFFTTKPRGKPPYYT